MKQRSFTIRKYGAFLTVLLVLSLVFGTFAGIPVHAEEGASASNTYNPNQLGSITVKLGDIGTQETTNKNGVELTIYQVGRINTENNYIQFDLVQGLADMESLVGVDLNDVTTAEANLAAAEKLEDAVLDAGLTAAGKEYTATVNGEDGVAVFRGENGEGLPQGMYLVQQTNANAYGITSPFLVAIPYMTDGANWIYDVVANPKGAEFDSLGSIQVTKALKYNNDGNLLDTTAENASYDIGLFMDSQGQYRYSGENWRQTVTIQGTSSSTVTFDNLPITSKPYYVFELDENGNAITYSSDLGGADSNNLFTVMAGEDPTAPNAGEAPEIILDTENNPNASATISNVYADLPDGYYVTGEITITKSVMDNGQMIATNYPFYAGIFTVDAQGNVNANPTEVVKLNNNGSVTVEVPLGGTNGTEPITYAVMETEEDGTLINKETFSYTVTGEANVNLSVDQTTGNVAITNTLKEGADGYYQDPSTQAPRDTSSNNNNNNNSSSDNRNTSSGTNRSSRSSRTGDNNQILLYGGLLAAAVIVGGVVVARRRRRTNG